MLSGSGLAFLPLLLLFLLLAPPTEQTAPGSCRCSAVQPAGLRVDCGSLGLREAPPVPAETAELRLHDNRLTAVPPGHFDGLGGLRRVALAGNPFHCDCGIRYLRAWLRDNGDAVESGGGAPVCASPRGVAGTPVAALGDAHFSSCAGRSSSCGGRGWCAEGAWFNGVAGLMVGGLVGLLLWALRLARRSAYILDISDRRADAEDAEPPRSLRHNARNTL